MLAVIVVMSLHGSAPAESQGNVRTLTCQDAIAIALNKSYTVKSFQADLQNYLWPRIQEPTTGATDRFCNIAKPEGILLVAAGGAGMAETWLLMPHLARAITRPIEPARA